MDTNKPLTGEPNILQTVPFFRVSAMDRSLQFYIDGLGYALTNKWEPRGFIEWCWLEREGAAIMLQEPRRDKPTPPLEGKPGLGVSITYQCRDAIALYREFLSRGLSPTEPFVGNGLWVTQVTDPDGYNLFFESPTDVQEGTVLSAITS